MQQAETSPNKENRQRTRNESQCRIALTANPDRAVLNPQSIIFSPGLVSIPILDWQLFNPASTTASKYGQFNSIRIGWIEAQSGLNLDWNQIQNHCEFINNWTSSS